MVNAESLDVMSKKEEKVIEKLIEADECFIIPHPYLRFYRNSRSPTGFIVTIEDGEETKSVRITVENMKHIIKEIIDTFET